MARIAATGSLCFATLAAIWLPQEPVAKAPPVEMRARIEVETHEQCFTVRLYVHNAGTAEQSLEHGRGGGGLSVVPRFHFGMLTIEPPKYLRPPRQSMRPDVTVVGAGKEVLYGTWTMGYPPVAPGSTDDLTATIEFREPKLRLDAAPVTLAIPAARADK